MFPEKVFHAQDASPPQDQSCHDVVLSVEQLSKKFCRSLKRSLYYGVSGIIQEVLAKQHHGERLRKGEFWALRSINLQLRQGEALGLIGANGAGKTTLLRIIGGLIKPDMGTVTVTGRVAPLIALQAGFNPILTGLENIYINMAILGLTKREIEHKVESVIDFAEIGEAIHAPVQTYSSGMAARLGFSCAIHTEPDILLIDEVLAVGDLKFAGKCHRKLYELREKGTSFILVSHNPYAILSVCTRVLYLSKGQLISSGEPTEIVNQYEADLFLTPTQESSGILHVPQTSQNSETGLNITSVFFRGNDGQIVESPISGQAVRLCLECKVHRHLKDVGTAVAIYEAFEEGRCSLVMTTVNTERTVELSAGNHEIQLVMPYIGLRAGSYNALVNVAQSTNYVLDRIPSFRFQIQQPQEPMSQCLFYQPHSWNIVDKQSLQGG